MKKIIKCCIALCLLPVLLFTSTFDIYGYEDLDLTKKGSLTISFNNEYPLDGSEYSIWQVATLEKVDGYKDLTVYKNAAGFEKLHASFTDESLDYWNYEISKPLIAYVWSFIEEHDIKPYRADQRIGSSNETVFKDLPLGIYYVRQTKLPASGYVTTDYLAAIPYQLKDENGNISSDPIYDVSTFGKTDPHKETEEVPESPNTAASYHSDFWKFCLAGSVLAFGALALGRKER